MTITVTIRSKEKKNVSLNLSSQMASAAGPTLSAIMVSHLAARLAKS
jgi:hypothetical protein